MQPEPLDFLGGIRRELLALLNPSASVGESMRGITLARAAEALLYLAVRQEALPAILADARPAMLGLLRRMIDLLEDRRIDVPVALRAAMGVADAPTIGEAGIVAHDRIAAALIDAFRLAPLDAPGLEALTAEAGAIEGDIMAARSRALERFRKQEADTVLPDESVVPDDGDLTAYLRHGFPEKPGVIAFDIRQQKGVNTKEIFFFTLANAGDWPREAVLRRNRPFDYLSNPVNEEHALLVALYAAGVPVPRPLAADGATALLHRPFLITEKSTGRPESIEALGDGAADVMRDLARALGRLHAVRPDQLASRRQTYGTGARTRTLRMLDRFERMWEDDRNQQWVTLGAAYSWLRANADIVGDQIAMVHGDYNLRNVLIADGRVSAVLDWELAHEGHPAEDLAYIRPQVEQVMAWEEYYRTYLDHGGIAVTDAEIAYFLIYSEAFRVSTIYPANNGYVLGRHGDFLIGSAGFIEHGEVMKDLADLLARLGRSPAARPAMAASSEERP